MLSSQPMGKSFKIFVMLIKSIYKTISHWLTYVMYSICIYDLCKIMVDMVEFCMHVFLTM